MLCEQGRVRVQYESIIVEGTRRMTITLPLEPQKEAKLIALAQEKGSRPMSWCVM